MTDLQIFLAVLVLLVTVVGIWFGVMWPKQRSRLEPPKPVPLAMREQVRREMEAQAKVPVRRDVQAYRRRTGGNDAA